MISKDWEHRWEETHEQSRLNELQLEGNEGNIPSDTLQWLKPMSASASDEEIRRELAEKGVVHLKGVMPREYVLNFRKRWFEALAPSGVLREGTDPVDGIFCGGNPEDFQGHEGIRYLGKRLEEVPYAKLGLDAQNGDLGFDFATNEYLMSMAKRFHPEWQQPAVVRRQIIRSNVPGAKKTATGVHYDQLFLRGGPPTFLTAWVPVGDVTPEQGGLLYLEDSVPLGRQMENHFTELCRQKGMTDGDKLSAFNENMFHNGMLSLNPHVFAETEGAGRKWLVGDYEAGDVVFHDAFSIHASGTNRDPQSRIRVSADLRFVDLSQPHDARWNEGPLTMDDGL
ncbi:hypothetical protein C365_01675 [Cryptococcus neoformans Bt85]|nr:hypothetical protein C365_01675 [Cryptococcus neoformans var. grubii Bt85]